MRIIAGELRGRKLMPPVGTHTRPITDRVKQSLFDILAHRIPGARVYDCFSGTGSLGLECLSRGARHVIFFERDRAALELLQTNIRSLKLTPRATVVPRDLFAWFDDAGPAEIDLVFLDPPYRLLRDSPLRLRQLAVKLAERHLAAEGIVVFRRAASDRLELPPLVRYDQREYGGMSIDFLRQP